MIHSFFLYHQNKLQQKWQRGGGRRCCEVLRSPLGPFLFVFSFACVRPLYRRPLIAPPPRTPSRTHTATPRATASCCRPPAPAARCSRSTSATTSSSRSSLQTSALLFLSLSSLSAAAAAPQPFANALPARRALLRSLCARLPTTHPHPIPHPTPHHHPQSVWEDLLEPLEAHAGLRFTVEDVARG